MNIVITELKFCAGCTFYNESLENINNNDLLQAKENENDENYIYVPIIGYHVSLNPINLCKIMKGIANNKKNIIIGKNSKILYDGKIIEACKIGKDYENSEIKTITIFTEESVFINIDGLWVKTASN